MSSCGGCPIGPSVNGQPPGGGGGAPVVIPPTLLSSLLEPVPVTDALVNTVTLLALPANTLATDGDILRLHFSGTLLQSDAVARNWFFGIQLNGVVLWGGVTGNYAISAVPRAFECFADIKRRSVSTCTLGGQFLSNVSAVAPVAGIGGITVAPQGNAIGSAVVDPACNWAAVQNVDLLFQASVAGINLTLRNATLQRLSTT